MGLTESAPLMFCYIPAGQRPEDSRVPLTPTTAGELAKLGLDLHAPAGLGRRSFYADEDYRAAGVTLTDDYRAALQAADLVLRVRQPPAAEIGLARTQGE